MNLKQLVGSWVEMAEGKRKLRVIQEISVLMNGS